jgi:tRNA(Ile2) C34 agmatinyltransferase TiaS
MILYIGLDDTDIIGTPGTGHLARTIAGQLSNRFPLLGVTRHQLLIDPRVPCTKKNSSAGIIFEVPADFAVGSLYDELTRFVINSSAEGSDPGLCMTTSVHDDVIDFGYKVKKKIVTQDEALHLAGKNGILLSGLGGNEDGVIGALSAVGLAASGNDGRYVMVGKSRDLQGLQPITAVLDAGISSVCSEDGTIIQDGYIQTDQLRPARRNGRPVAVVQWTGSYWMPLKLD